MELFLYSSPVAYWVPTNLGVHLSVSYLFVFSYFSWGSQGKNTEVTLQETDPDLPVSVQESLVEAWVSSHPLQGRGH